MKKSPATIALIFLLLFFSGSIWLVFEYVAAEKQRDLSDWEARLNIMAESQQSSIENWFTELTRNISSLANNPLVQIYVSQGRGDDASIDETQRGQRQYLKNLMHATAKHARVFTTIENIKGEAEGDIQDGLALVDDEGVLMSTAYFHADEAKLSDVFTTVASTGKSFISDIYALEVASGEVEPRVMIAVPVNAVQSLDPGDVRAVVVAVIDPQQDLYRLLLKSWLTTVSDESILVTVDNDSISYLSPMIDGFTVFHQQPVDTSLEAAAVSSMGELMSGRDYRGTDVIAIAVPVRSTSMTLVQKINSREAFLESTNHRNFILIVFVLLVSLITLGFILIWKHASSLRLQKATSRLRARAELLSAVGDSINDHIFLLDHEHKLVFINEALATGFSIDAAEVRGKALDHVFGSEITTRLLSVIPQDSQKEVRNREMRLQFADSRRDYHVSVVALSHPGYHRSFLFVMHDITRLKDAQGQHNRLMLAIISTLTDAIDKHDPHCQHHSKRTREVAVAIARTMGLTAERIELLALAALLANIGKLFIPAEKLTSIEPLTEDEESMLKQSTVYSVDILQDLEFEGPVIDFVRQKNECLDGSGYPDAISGDGLLLESRILSVANAFVAMTSSRAYREGKPVTDVLDLLLTEADTRYDRSVIEALFTAVENHPEWLNWQQVR